MPPLRDRLARLPTSVRRAVLRRRRPLAALLVAVAVATGLRAATGPPAPRVPVPVAAHDLAPGAVVAADDLVRAGFAPGSVPSGVVRNPVGRIVAAPVRAGEPVTDVRLLGPRLTDAYPGLAAVPVRLPDAGMAGLLRVGDRIDLVAADPQGAAAARVVAADVPVLALPGDDRERAIDGSLTGRLVVLGARPDEVPALAGAAVRYFLTFTWDR
ncbi:SAF domain-containing protein [Nocardioides panaciterrulae]|uniref:Flp pilus assembly protein CpaB n=1 Tax=Nocardioides panaciterrulae TaxID=661492 RepID=A0A7Y9E8V0_9ACTN|nr:SAF domain-containing protein [Nocardioides panaciterrulae]NYD43333.1 Flp pilus assembly protein CpaB [Nocardioides panaciterrulae]